MTASTDHRPFVLLADIEPAMAGLLLEWLADAGITAASADEGAPDLPPGLLLVDLPYPRQSGAARLRTLAQRWPGVPVLAISAAFFAGVPARGELARALGAAGVLPAPVSREALLALVRELLDGRP